MTIQTVEFAAKLLFHPIRIPQLHQHLRLRLRLKS